MKLKSLEIEIRQQLVKLWKRPSRDGKSYVYNLLYTDLGGKRRFESLGHGDKKKAEKQRLKKEKELRMGFCPVESMLLRDFMEDSLKRTGSNIRPSTKEEYQSAMEDFIKVVGNIDFQSITLEHGEFYRQECIDRGNTSDTVRKKLIEIRRFFKLAVKRQQLDENPLEHIDLPRSTKKKVRVYSNEECRTMLKAARDFISEKNEATTLRWDLILFVALQTGMRRGELFNLVWSDIDFDKCIIDITPKAEKPETWEWKIKDHEERPVPISPQTAQLLIDLQSKRPTGYPYVFIPTSRYDYIQTQLRPKGKWSFSSSRTSIFNNFYKQFDNIFLRADIKKKGKFHDTRSTALSNWFAQGLSEYKVMKLAGHSNFETTRKFYLSIKDDYLDTAREMGVQFESRLGVEDWVGR